MSLDQVPRYDQAVEQMKSRKEQAERRLAAAGRERDEKIPEYEENRLFRYLLDRRYGTRDYHARGLTHRLDDWVAGKLDFTSQMQNYTLLQEIPSVVERELGALEADAHRW